VADPAGQPWQASLATAAGELRRQLAQLAKDVDAATGAWRHAVNDAWLALSAAAGTVRRQAAGALLSAGPGRAAADPVRAAAAVMCVDEVAAVNLSRLVRNAIPQQTAVDPADLDTSLRAGDALFAVLQRNDTLLSGLDGIFIPLLAAAGSDGGTRLAAAMAQLTPVPAETGAAFRDIAAFAHHPLHGISSAGVLHAALHHIERGFMPALGSASGEHGLMALAEVPGMLSGGLLGTLFDSPEEFPLKAAELVAKSFGEGYLGQAARSPLLEHAQNQAETALHQVAHAAGLALPDVLHGLVSHVPFVTIALSATREIRLYRQQKTTLDHAILNVAVDTGGVIAGIGAAELGLHAAAAAWHPAAPIQIALTAGGAIAGRSIAKQVRLRHWKKARAEYETLSKSHADLAGRLAAQVTDTARHAVERERSLYLTRVGYPELMRQAESTELAALIRRLREATSGYAGTVRSLLEAGATPVPPAINGALGSVRDCAVLADDGRYASALLTLTADPVPVPDGWGPGREYRELCWQTATRISELSDGSRARVARWATDSTAEFQRHAAAIGSVVTPALERARSQSETARAALEAAAAAERREADAAGVKRKE
jgi:hypothetical protein